MSGRESPDPTREKVMAKEEGPDVAVGEVRINASGHKDQLQRQYRLIALCALALNIDNAWIALGGSVTIAIGKCELPRIPSVCRLLTISQQMVALPASSMSSL